MSSKDSNALAANSETLSEEAVRDYLKTHSDFLQRHPDMLDHLHVSHASGSAVSLVEKQVSVLRERNIEMRRRLNSLTANARENEQLYEKTRELLLALLDANDLGALSTAFHHSMKESFGVDYAAFILFGERADSANGCRFESLDKARIEIGGLLKGGKDICGPLRAEELNYLFPDSGEVGSAALVTLGRNGDMGLIAVGADDPQRYSSAMGTLFLGHIGEVLQRLVPRLSRA